MAYLAAPLLSATADPPHSLSVLVPWTDLLMPGVLVITSPIVILPAPALDLVGGYGSDPTHGYAG
jgi:hypothetical protein